MNKKRIFMLALPVLMLTMALAIGCVLAPKRVSYANKHTIT